MTSSALQDLMLFMMFIRFVPLNLTTLSVSPRIVHKDVLNFFDFHI